VSAGRPLHLRPWSLGLVFAGGGVGTAGRAVLSTAVPAPGGVPVVVVAINIVGAFALGLLLARLLRSGPDAGPRRDLRLLLGTGVLGGFTTYSTLATDTVTLLAAGRVGAGAGYALATLVLGLPAALLGLHWGGSRRRDDR
jgi:CrcB protein